MIAPCVPRIALALLAVLAGAAAAQEVCADELQAQAAAVEGDGAGLAASVLRRAVELVEPAYPVTHAGADERVSNDAPGAQHARWLARRGFLPDGWPAELDAAGWTEILRHVQGRYDAGRVEVEGTLQREAILADVGATLRAVHEAIRPLALFATELEDPEAIAFRGVIWNWTPHPRFLIFEPEGRLGEGGDPRPALERIGTCALRPGAYLVADEETAASLYLGSEQSRMRILAVTPPREGVELPLDVPSGAESSFLRFEAPKLQGVRIAAVAFEGPGPGILQTLDLLGDTQSNVHPLRLRRYFQFPP